MPNHTPTVLRRRAHWHCTKDTYGVTTFCRVRHRFMGTARQHWTRETADLFLTGIATCYLGREGCDETRRAHEVEWTKAKTLAALRGGAPIAGAGPELDAMAAGSRPVIGMLTGFEAANACHKGGCREPGGATHALIRAGVARLMCLPHAEDELADETKAKTLAALRGGAPIAGAALDDDVLIAGDYVIVPQPDSTYVLAHDTGPTRVHLACPDALKEALG